MDRASRSHERQIAGRTGLAVLDGAPVAVGVVAVDRPGKVVGTAGLP